MIAGEVMSLSRIGEAGLIEALFVAIVLSAIPLAAMFLTGLIMAVFQGATQIQEQTLSFIPKMIACAATLWIFRSFSLVELTQLFERAFDGIAHSH